MRVYSISFSFRLLFMVLCFPFIASSQSCDQFTTEVSCVSSSGGACDYNYIHQICQCASTVKLDILFGIDTSSSVGYNGFQIVKQFIETLAIQGINNNQSRIGFTTFATNVNESKEIQQWNINKLTSYIPGIYWTSGWRNTGELLSSGLTTFNRTNDPSRQQIFLIITNGNPCLPDSQGGCPIDICQYATKLKQANIRVVIVGVGDGVKMEYMGCLTQSDDDFIPVADFSTDAFDSIMGSLSDIFCPISKDFKITEVKAEKKPTGWNSRWTRFVEIYNQGIDFTIDDIAIDGLISMTLGNGPSVNISQGQYVVFYDASDEPLGFSAIGSTPTCHSCEDPCDLTNCSSTSEGYTGYCWCKNSIYVACGNTGDGITNCDNNVLETGGEDACSVCTFNDAMDRSSWDITFSDSGGNIDSVVYDSSTWIETDDGYSYELISKGFDNDLGDNWALSCSVFGTPGTDPATSCSTTCNSAGIDCGDGGVCDTDTGLCVCDESTGYYPDCLDETTCLKCKSTPTIDNCLVKWEKNGTDRYALFNWSESQTDKDSGYILYWFDATVSCPNGVIGGSPATGCDVITDNPTYVYALQQRIDLYYSYNDTIGGYVTSYMNVCEDDGLSCNQYESARIPCRVITQSPTFSPTDAPTYSPSSEPTGNPTPSPTWACPLYWWENEDVCNSDTNDGYAGDRCECTMDTPVKQCCLLDPDWTGTYDPDRQHKTDYACKLDVELANPEKRSDGESEAGTADGYLLTEGDHTFTIGIYPDNYPCKMDISWKLEFNTTDCDYSNGSSTCTNTTTCVSGDDVDLAAAGLEIYPMNGFVKIWGANDVNNASITFNVKRLSCSDRAIYGNLLLANATNDCQPDCYDGRIYPMRIPVWYYYAAGFVAPPDDTKTPTSTNPTTQNPTTPNPTTSNPTTANPTTPSPTISPNTANPTSTPTTYIPTSSPTTANPTAGNPTSAGDEAQQIQVDIDTESTLFIGIVIVCAGAVVIGVACILYLLCLSGLLKRTQQPGTASVKKTIKALGLLGIIGVALEIFDIVTDYLYAVDLITSKNNDIRQLGWVSLFSAILGLSLFGIKMLVTRKLIGSQVTKLRQKLTSKLSTEETIEIVTKIRKRRLDVDVLCLLIACVEDVPQALIVVIVINSNTDWNAISILNFSLACISFVWKLIQVASAKLGCKDPEVGDEDIETEMVTQRELQHVKLDSNDTEYGVNGNSQ